MGRLKSQLREIRNDFEGKLTQSNKGLDLVDVNFRIVTGDEDIAEKLFDKHNLIFTKDKTPGGTYSNYKVSGKDQDIENCRLEYGLEDSNTQKG